MDQLKRARIPLNHQAFRAATDRLERFPKLKGGKLNSKYRRLWMEEYEKAGGAIQASVPSRPGGVLTKCPLAQKRADQITGTPSQVPKQPPRKKTKRKRAKQIILPCFKCEGCNPDQLKELKHQLKNQQAAINNMTVEQYIENRDTFRYKGMMGERRRKKGISRKARRNFELDLRNQYVELLEGANPEPARGEMTEANYKKLLTSRTRKLLALAKKSAAEHMKTLAALHNPDMVVGGADVIYPRAFGDLRVNESIGSQWTCPVLNKKKKQTSRVEMIDEAAEKIESDDREDTKMNVKLEACT